MLLMGFGPNDEFAGGLPGDLRGVDLQHGFRSSTEPHGFSKVWSKKSWNLPTLTINTWLRSYSGSLSTDKTWSPTSMSMFIPVGKRPFMISYSSPLI